MNDKQRKFIDDITWGIKMKVPQLIAVSLSKRDDFELVYGKMQDILTDEHVRPLVQLCDREKQRYLVIIGIEPVWGWVVKRIPDKWDYTTTVHDLKEILHG